MTTIVGVVVAAVLFGLFGMLRPRKEGDGCTGNCIGCARDSACEREGAKR